jgi:hypothetical protein
MKVTSLITEMNATLIIVPMCFFSTSIKRLLILLGSGRTRTTPDRAIKVSAFELQSYKVNEFYINGIWLYNFIARVGHPASHDADVNCPDMAPCRD